LPAPVSALFEVAKLRIFARSHQIEEIVHQGKMVKFGPIQLAESMQIRLSRLHPGSIIKSSTRTILIPVPASEVDLLSWATQVITEVIATPILKAGAKS
jgi:transcription-repair coupling factor (superfamily II helicase)